MSSQMAIVNVDADTPSRLCEFVSQLVGNAGGNASEFLAEAEQLLQKGDSLQLITKLLQQSELIFNLEDNAEVENVIQATYTTMYSLTDVSNEKPEVVQAIVGLLTKSETHSRKRLSALISLFNLTSTVASKFTILLAIFSFARQTQQTQQIAHFHVKYDDWSKAWNLSVAQQRSLLRAMIDAADKDQKQSLECAVKFFRTFQKANEKITGDAEAVLVAALVSAIKSPVSAHQERIALLESLTPTGFAEPVQSLLALLHVLCDGSLEDFLKLKAAAGSVAVFEKHGLNLDEIERAVKLLTLCTLAANSTTKIISFQDVQTALRVTEDEVELWLIDAIASGLVDGAIDQIKRNITVTRYAYRSFGQAQWVSLQQKLRLLNKNLAGALETIKRNKTPGAK